MFSTEYFPGNIRIILCVGINEILQLWTLAKAVVSMFLSNLIVNLEHFFQFISARSWTLTLLHKQPLSRWLSRSRTKQVWSLFIHQPWVIFRQETVYFQHIFVLACVFYNINTRPVLSREFLLMFSIDFPCSLIKNVKNPQSAGSDCHFPWCYLACHSENFGWRPLALVWWEVSLHVSRDSIYIC